MKKILTRILYVALILGILAGAATVKLVFDKRDNEQNDSSLSYDSNQSITYRKAYSALEDELLYVRIIKGDDSTGRKTIAVIRDKQQLIEIVREFDKLKAALPENKERRMRDHASEPMAAVMWREGKSVTYSIEQVDSRLYYWEGPRIQLKEIPESLIELLQLTDWNAPL